VADKTRSIILSLIPESTCCRNKKKVQKYKDKIFNDSMTQLAQTFDIRNLLKSMRRIEVLFTVLLDKKQQKLMGVLDREIMIDDSQ